MAPEILENTGYDTKADIWSFGILAMELGYGRAPYSKYDPLKILLSIINNDPPKCDIYNDVTYKFSNDYHKMISLCLHKDPKERPTVCQLLKHSFFKHTKDADYIKTHISI